MKGAGKLLAVGGISLGATAALVLLLRRRRAVAPVIRRDVDGQRTVSAAGLRFIAAREGFRPNLYNDAANHCTIGYGHLVHRGPCDGSEPAEFRQGITRERGLELLELDVAAAVWTVVHHVDVPLAQHQLDALVSFVFNVGSGAFARSTLREKLNSGDYDSVPGELARWTKAGGKVLAGLVQRRRLEGRMFQGPLV